jgi:hypothetical protein
MSRSRSTRSACWTAQWKKRLWCEALALDRTTRETWRALSRWKGNFPIETRIEIEGKDAAIPRALSTGKTGKPQDRSRGREKEVEWGAVVEAAVGSLT